MERRPGEPFGQETDYTHSLLIRSSTMDLNGHKGLTSWDQIYQEVAGREENTKLIRLQKRDE